MNTNIQDARISKTRQKVMDAGAVLLFTQGWDHVTHQKLAQETGIARGTLYRHWSTIDDLLVDIVINCDPAPYAAKITGNLPSDLVEELALLITNLHNSKLGDVILNAARMASDNPKIAIIHRTTQKILLESLIKKWGGAPRPSDDHIANMLLGPVLYHHLFGGSGTLDLEQLVHSFLTMHQP